jgi:Na+/melibiose symporter-like transporter
MEQQSIQYNRAKMWQLALFPLNNLATNCFMFLMNFISYLAVGGYGILVSVASLLITSSRIFDGVTDPAIGFVIDRTSGRFGKFRPMILLGYVITTVAVLLMYFVGIGGGVPVFISLYMLYIIGYSFQTSCTRAAQAVLTNDPSQRPLFTRFNGIYVLIYSALFSFYVSNHVVPKYRGLNVPALQEMCITAIIIAGILTALVIVSLWEKDVPEHYGIDPDDKIKLIDYWKVLKSNRPILMVIIAASTDKLASQISSNSSVIIMIFGIVVGNYAFQGRLSMIAMIPSILVILFGSQYARKFGSKKAVVILTWLCIITSALLFLVFVIFDPVQIGNGIGVTAVFLVIWCANSGLKSITSGLTNPMIADCTDYELYKSGKFVPGLMGTLFSFADKLVSSLAATIVGFLLVSIGYVDTLPQVTDALTSGIFWVALFCFIGIPILGWVATIISMKFYPLTEAKMVEIQTAIAEKKAAFKEAGKRQAAGTPSVEAPTA